MRPAPAPEAAGPGGPILNLPPVTKALLLVNLAVHLLRYALPARLENTLVVFLAFAPVRYTTIDWSSWPGLLSPLTYQFLHGGLAHLAINMMSLAAFGSGVERRLGAARMLLLYLACGIAGAVAEFAVDPQSPRLLIGASGAISGLFAGVLWFAMRQQRFWLVVALWIGMNVLTGEVGLVDGGAPVAWVAHLGGFVVGLALFPLLDRRMPRKY